MFLKSSLGGVGREISAFDVDGFGSLSDQQLFSESNCFVMLCLVFTIYPKFPTLLQYRCQFLLVVIQHLLQVVLSNQRFHMPQFWCIFHIVHMSHCQDNLSEDCIVGHIQCAFFGWSYRVVRYPTLVCTKQSVSIAIHRINNASTSALLLAFMSFNHCVIFKFWSFKYLPASLLTNFLCVNTKHLTHCLMNGMPNISPNM